MVMEEARKGKALLQVWVEDSPFDPRKHFDPAGVMVCWHDRYILGDVHGYSDPSDFLLGLVTTHNVDGLYEWAENQVLMEQRGDEWAVFLKECPEESYLHETKDEAEYDRSIWIDQIVSGDDRNIELSPDLLWGLLPDDLTILPLYLYDHGGLSMNTEGFSCPWDSGQVGYIYMTAETAKREGITDPEKYLRGEVKEYDSYLRGEVYGFTLMETHTCSECGSLKPETLDTAGGFYGYESLIESLKSYLPNEYVSLVDELDPVY